MRVSEIREKRIRVNQGLGVVTYANNHNGFPFLPIMKRYSTTLNKMFLYK